MSRLSEVKLRHSFKTAKVINAYQPQAGLLAEYPVHYLHFVINNTQSGQSVSKAIREPRKQKRQMKKSRHERNQYGYSGTWRRKVSDWSVACIVARCSAGSPSPSRWSSLHSIRSFWRLYPNHTLHDGLDGMSRTKGNSVRGRTCA